MTRWLLVVVAIGCREDARRDDRPTNLPAAPSPLHPATRAGIELGRTLFFDPRLSGNDTISCATCHDPAKAFTDGVARSTAGSTGVALPRNTPSLANIAWVPALFADGGAKNLESLVMGPIQHPDEMGEQMERLIAQLAADPAMTAAFRRAFPREQLSPSTVMRALAQYMRSLVSATSRYDRYVRDGDELADSELRGLATYRAKCASCHATDLFTDLAFHDIGLDPAGELPKEDHRRGRARVTFKASDERAYRTPSLRNLGYTAPYMHDGRFATLEQVLDHYRHTPSLDPALKGGIALTDDEVRDLLAFLKTLDDPAFVERNSR